MNNNNIKYSIPSLFDNNELMRLVLINNNNGVLSEIYGAIRSKFPTGRPNDTKNVTKECFVQNYKMARKLGLQTNYLLNGIYDYERSNIIDRTPYLEWIFSEVKPDIVTVSDRDLMSLLVQRYDVKNIKISAIAGVKSVCDLMYYLQADNIADRVKGVVLHHDITAMLCPEIEKVIAICEKNQIIPSVIVNESCYYGCVHRKKHYSLVGEAVNNKNTYYDFYQALCFIKRMINPETILDLVGFIPPELVLDYSGYTGIKSFKISGRSNTSKKIISDVKAYIDGKSYENVFEYVLFSLPNTKFFEKYSISDIIYLNSCKYIELLFEVKDIKDIEKRKKKYKSIIGSMLNDGSLRINKDIVEFVLKNNSLCFEKTS